MSTAEAEAAAEATAKARAEHAVHEGALRGALVTRTTNIIDTSTHYLDGGSERMIGRVLSDLDRTGEVEREGVVVVTKVGHVSPSSTSLPSGAVAHSAAPQQGQHQVRGRRGRRRGRRRRRETTLCGWCCVGAVWRDV
jgi:aryl-alcohol dehydrogenase-like predicted oxidoreductase